MPSRTRTLAALCTAPLLALVPAATGSAASFPDTIPLPDSSSPEGIAGGTGTTLYAGSRNTGQIVIADARTGTSRVLVPTRADDGDPDTSLVVGMDYDPGSKVLWVAGGTTGDVLAYDGRTGELLHTVDTGGGRFLNDVGIGKDAVYVTDSRNAELIVVTDEGYRELALTGDYVQPAGFGANGIRVLPDGTVLLVSGGALYEVDPTTGVADRLEQTGGEPLTSGDGLELRGRTLYVVNGFGDARNSVAVVKLGDGSFTVTGELSEEPGVLDRPTTGALLGNALYVVNGKFGTPDATEFEIVRVETR